MNFALIYTAAAFIITGGYVQPITAFQVVSVVNAGIVMSFLPAAAFIPEFIRAKVSAGLMFKMMNEPTKIDNMSDQGLKPVTYFKIRQFNNIKIYRISTATLKFVMLISLILIKNNSFSKTLTLKLIGVKRSH